MLVLNAVRAAGTSVQDLVLDPSRRRMCNNCRRRAVRKRLPPRHFASLVHERPEHPFFAIHSSPRWPTSCSCSAIRTTPLARGPRSIRAKGFTDNVVDLM